MKKHMKDARTRERARIRVVLFPLRVSGEFHPTGRSSNILGVVVVTEVSGEASASSWSEVAALVGCRQLVWMGCGCEIRMEGGGVNVAEGATH